MTEVLRNAFFTLAVAFIVSVVISFPIMWIWNSTFPDLFGTKEIGLWTTWKIMMFVSLVTPISIKAASHK